MKMFPVLPTTRRERDEPRTKVMWSLVEPLRDRCLAAHDQTLERLAERGGLSRGELYSHVHGQNLFPPPDADVVRAWFDAWRLEAAILSEEGKKALGEAFNKAVEDKLLEITLRHVIDPPPLDRFWKRTKDKDDA